MLSRRFVDKSGLAEGQATLRATQKRVNVRVMRNGENHTEARTGNVD